MAPRPKPRLHAQTQGSGEGARVTRRSRPHLHPQTQANEDGALVTRCRRSRGKSPAAAASLPDDDDMLREILLRLPPQPSTLPRASAVCRRWRGIVTDPKFLRQFYAHHRKPPLLGVFRYSNQGIVFTPVLDPPDRVPPERFDIGLGRHGWYNVLDCRHGRLLVLDFLRKHVFVCVPITGEVRRVAIPAEYRACDIYGAVVCAASDEGHIHADCHSSPFKVVLLSMYRQDNRPTATVYSSETGICGNLISTEATCQLYDGGVSPTLIGNTLYWLSTTDRILKFGLDDYSLAVIMGPSGTNDFCHGSRQIIQANDGDVGFAILSYPHFQMWQRNVNGHGVDTWMMWKTIEVHNILGLPLQIEGAIRHVKILGYDEENCVLFVSVDASVYTVQVTSMQSRKLYETQNINDYHPFTSFYTPGMAIAGSRHIG